MFHRAVLAIIFAALACSIAQAITPVEYIEPSRIRVIDGDTVRVDGKRPDYRLIGYNAPEVRGAKCEAERELGRKARARLRELVGGGRLSLIRVFCSCSDGTETGEAI